MITKFDAAQRLIVAGIAMSDRGDDPLAVHVVASSALNLLRELIEQGGDDYVTRVIQQGAYHCAMARLKGEELNLPVNGTMEAVVAHVVKGLEADEIKQPSDLILTISADERHKLLAYITRPFNFLKHAQRDPLATLEEDDVHPTGALAHALTALSILDPDRKYPDEIGPFLAEHGFT